MVHVKFETAVLASEKGFPKLNTGYGYNENGQIVDPCFSKATCEAQYQWQLQDWLREKHKIHVAVSPWKESFVSSNRKQHRTVYEGNVINEKDNWRTIQLSSFSKNYEDCMEDCLIFALNLIINNCNKQ